MPDLNASSSWDNPLASRSSLILFPDFERLDTTIRSYISSAEEVAIAIDYTGGHYSEPIVYFLQAKGYTVYHLEAEAIKAARKSL